MEKQFFNKNVFKNKRIHCFLFNRKYIELKAKLKNEGMRISYFLNAVITGYLDHDPGILLYLDKYNRKLGLGNKSKTARLEKELEEVKTTKKNFGLSDEEVSNIFDLLEEEVSLLP